MRLELYSLFTMEEVSHVLAVIKSSVDVLSKKMPYVYGKDMTLHSTPIVG